MRRLAIVLLAALAAPDSVLGQGVPPRPPAPAPAPPPRPAPQPPAPERTPAAAPTEADDRTRAERLLDDLQRTEAKLKGAQGQVERVQALIKELDARVESGAVDQSTGVKARRETIVLLKRSIDELYQTAMAVRDGVNGSIIPDKDALIARVKARAEAATDESERDQLNGVREKLVQERSRIASQVDRLGLNIEKLKGVRTKLTKQMSFLDLLKEIADTGQKVAAELEKFNDGLEQIHRELEVAP